LDSARTILVVGSSQSRRARSVTLLTSAGHHVVAVATVAEAIAYVATESPPLVVIDFAARDCEAMTACRRIKGEYPDTFILQISPRMTGDAVADPDIERCIDAYLVDPIDPQEMLVLVRSLLRLQKVEMDLRDSEERLLLAQESAGLAILDWVIPTNTFIHSANFVDVFDLAPRGSDVPLSPAMLLERIHPEDLDALLAEFSDQSLSARDFEKSSVLSAETAASAGWRPADACSAGPGAPPSGCCRSTTTSPSASWPSGPMPNWPRSSPLRSMRSSGSMSAAASVPGTSGPNGCSRSPPTPCSGNLSSTR
jgi:CheY-like chemotaxis protein